MLSRFEWFTNYGTRKLEWMLAIYTVYFGVWLIMPWQSMSGESFSNALSFIPESGWGTLYITVGIVHNTALHVNGRGWWTPFVRSTALFMNASVFLALSLNIASINPGGTGVATYTFIVFGFCGTAFFTAAQDCGRELKIWRHKRNVS